MGSGRRVGSGGLLAAEVDELGSYLLGLGYAPATVVGYERVLLELSGWLDVAGIEPSALDAAVVERFIEAKWRARRKNPISVRVLVKFLEERGLMPTASPAESGPVPEVLAAYRRYMRVERRLAETTMVSAQDIARRFLSVRLRSGSLDLCHLDAVFVQTFVLGEARRLSPGSMRALVGGLRGFLRFLFATGVVGRDLSGGVPSAADSRLSSLPKSVDMPTVQALLDSCDRTTPTGLRDFAILVLLVRLGLRANEVATMRLDDIEWRSGELVVRGKARRVERLPLPADVGEALACYLRDGRPRSASRSVFLRAVAPAGAMSRNAVVFVSRSASGRAGIGVVGAHRLRHTAATQMLRHGATLREVGQVLRHQGDATTAIYAKVDRATLNLVVRPWPEAGR